MHKKIQICKEVLLLQKEAGRNGKKFARIHRDFVKLWAGYFEQNAKEWVAYVENNQKMFVNIQKSADFEETNKGLLSEMFILGMIAQEEAIQAQITVGISLDLRNEEAITYATARAGDLTKGVDETTRNEMKTIFDNALSNGTPLKDVQKIILDKFSEFSEYRASLIAVMETGNAYEQGKMSQFDRYADKFGVTGYKKSKAHHDSSSRAEHIANEKEGWIPAKQPFEATGTMTAPHGFNCRCAVTWSLFNPDEEVPEWV